MILYLGVVVIVSTTIPLAIGIWADRQLEMKPWLALVGMLVGATAATVGIWRIVQHRYTQLEQRHGRKDGNKEAGP